MWELSRHSAGQLVRFVTDATTISARWSLYSDNLSMHHMPATGVSGLDLYVRTDRQAAQWHWLGIGSPTQQYDNQSLLTPTALPRGRREFTLYLPLYNGIERLEIGLSEGATLSGAPPWPGGSPKPICFYGTSIVQGACASRPGMAYPAIVSRGLELPHLNLGFSGNARTEPEVVRLLAELDPCAYVLDPLPNMNGDIVAERIEHCVVALHEARPKTPIVLVESVYYQQPGFVQSRRAPVVAKNRALNDVYRGLVDRVDGLHLVSGGALLGADGEATVDGVHPNDLGFMRMADKLRPLLARLCSTES